jgi:hypothetical protein
MGTKRNRLWNSIQVLLSSPQFWAVVGSMLTALWAWAKGWFASPYAPLTIPIILLVVALTFYLVNQVKSTRAKRGLTKLSHKEIETQVREWIDISAWKIQKGALPNGVLLSYDLTHGDLPIHIERQAKQPEVFYLASEISLTHLVPKNKRMSREDWESLAGKLAIEMARQGIQWSFSGDEGDKKLANKEERIRLIDYVILDDSLTGFYFREKVMFVVRALILVIEVSREFFKGIPDKPVSHKEVFQTE